MKPDDRPPCLLPNGKVNPEYRRWYNQSEAGKAARKKYQQSEKYKASRRKYYRSDKGKAVVKAYRDSKKYDPDHYADRILTELTQSNAQLY